MNSGISDMIGFKWMFPHPEIIMKVNRDPILHICIYIYTHYDNESDPVFLVVFQQKPILTWSPPAMFSMEGVKPGSCRLRVTPERPRVFRHVYLVLLKPILPTEIREKVCPQFLQL